MVHCGVYCDTIHKSYSRLKEKQNRAIKRQIITKCLLLTKVFLTRSLTALVFRLCLLYVLSLSIILPFRCINVFITVRSGRLQTTTQYVKQKPKHDKCSCFVEKTLRWWSYTHYATALECYHPSLRFLYDLTYAVLNRQTNSFLSVSHHLAASPANTTHTMSNATRLYLAHNKVTVDADSRMVSAVTVFGMPV